MKRLAAWSLVLAIICHAEAALAQDEPTYDRIDLMANASSEVENDLLIAVVFAEVEDNNQTDAADAVNTAITWAADRARRVTGIDLETMSYSTRPLYANGRRIVGWVARQSLRLESRDAEALSALLGELQERVAVQSINYSVSDEASERAEEALIVEALAQFNRRATLIATELGRPGFRIVRLNVGTAGGRPPGFFDLSAARIQTAEAAPPTLEAGTQTMTVTVSGEIELDPA